jgi:hypothetical protein
MIDNLRFVRFVVVATVARGVLDEPELLDDAGQWQALRAWGRDEGRRVRMECGDYSTDNRVVWAKNARIA